MSVEDLGAGVLWFRAPISLQVGRQQSSDAISQTKQDVTVSDVLAVDPHSMLHLCVDDLE